MDFLLYKILLTFIIGSLIGIESILDEFQLHRPLICCTIVGMILGDITKGISIGGSLELISLGWMNIGAAVAPDTALASIISTILVINGKQNPGAGIALAIPLAAAGQILTIIVRSITIGFQHWVDKIAEKTQNTFHISCIHISALMLQAMRIAIPAIIVNISVETTLIKNILNSIPLFITEGLNVAGGIVVVVGYAMVINMMKTNYLMPFFFLGFIIAAFTQFNLVALGIMGTILSILYIQLSPKYSTYNINKKIVKDDELD